MIRCILETQVSRPNADANIDGTQVCKLGYASTESQEDWQARLRNRIAFAISAEGNFVYNPLKFS